ncbi:DUF7312 domain-containing protein [Halostagnicola kamekurae]|uniref:Uncharacterized protein n=1 Tax=Halostagnicola kamekurae TaxID=619731 RepID=A0A1I6RX47_9EURY|nr:hypothetical protein [Halostagnicola kamekurae]SFS69262.1 hypothetical protein SAMN04488556_2292 [Halostagnicola kamekurae]
MTEEPSDTDPDDRPDQSRDDRTPDGDGSTTDADPFEDTFVVKETKAVDPSDSDDDASEPSDRSSGPGDDDRSDDGRDEGQRIGSRYDDTQQDDGGHDEWGRIPIDLTDDDDGASVESTAGAEDTEDDEAVPEPSSTPIVSESPSLEGAVFVALGAIATILVMFRLGSMLFA